MIRDIWDSFDFATAAGIFKFAAFCCLVIGILYLLYKMFIDDMPQTYFKPQEFRYGIDIEEV